MTEPARTGLPPTVTVSYGSDPLQTAAFFPAATSGAPLAILVHGGGFLSSEGDATKLKREATDLQRAGVTAVVVNYRSDATVPAFPDQVDDVLAGTRYAIAHAAAYNATGARVMMIGGSSGGTLVADAAVQLASAVQVVAILSGTLDVASALAYWSAQKGALARLHVAHITAALGGNSAASVSPTTLVSQSADQGQDWYIYASQSEDPIVGAMADEATADLRADHVPVVETTFPGKAHSFAYWAQVNSQLASLAKAIP